ncbi:glycosyltransferase family 2 protein [Desulfosporosinus hippei]|uniref:Glycosyl transferase family 2 n=1 Tax=Desulfosporosinus hippei DSM 8344 TaxID=1121419 RepID=A0A1G8IXB4_9FIRM|nr:glycosyltransferase [Desulfosporosinus hippei]SDI23695.1 hypothetical protein SAMN05443529_13031 [Desulfosporosinus hippei DSM 8344]
MDFEVVIISHRPHLCSGAELCLKAHNYRVFDGRNYPSFSKLVNDCIISSKHETIIICNEKARPTPQAVGKILVMLNEGWGIVALFRFGFFGFKKDLIRKIGFFDERFIGGGYEDVDFARRLKEANIGYYESEEIQYIHLPTSWNYEKTNFSRNQYFRKWKEAANIITRQLAEEDYPYDLGPFQNTKFIEFEKSVLLPYHGNIKEIKMKTEL